MNSKLHHGTRFVSETDLCTPNGIRTRAATLKGWCPRPLDDGGKEFEFVGRASEIYQRISQVALGSNALWRVIIRGAGAWTAAASPGSRTPLVGWQWRRLRQPHQARLR